MSKARDKHEQRRQELSLFGKDLTRRSGACCELCAASGVGLSIYEVEPVAPEPVFARCIFLCEQCKEQVEYPKRRQNDHWRCLNTAIWSEVAAVKVLSGYMLRELADRTDWAEDLQEMLYLEPQQQAWLEKISN